MGKGLKIRQLLSSYFMQPSRWHNLGLLRICLGYVALTHYGGKTLASFHAYEVVPSLHRPPFLLDWLSLPYPLPPEYLEVFQYGFWVSGALAIIGLLTRPALLVFALHLLYMMGTQAARGWFDHEAGLTVQVLIILALVPGSNSFSIEKVLKWGYRYFKGNKAGLFSVLIGRPVPAWGVRLLLIVMATVYFTSGYSKFRFSDGKWLDGKTLTFYLDGRASVYKEKDAQKFFGPANVPDKDKWKDGFGPTAHHYMNARKGGFKNKLGKKMASMGWLMLLFAAGTAIFELLGPVILLGGWFRTLYLLGAIGMHYGIGVLMNIHFTEFQVVDFFLINWVWVWGSLSSRLPFLSSVQGTLQRKLKPKYEQIKTTE